MDTGIKILEELKIELALSASDANVSILSRGSRQAIKANPPAGGGDFKHIREVLASV